MVLYKIDDLGLEAHISLGFVPSAMATLFCEGVGAITESEACAVVYVAHCDYNRAVSRALGNAPGNSHFLGIDSHHVGEPIFNGFRRMATLSDGVCVYAAAAIPDDEKVGLTGNLHSRTPRETCRHPSPTITPLNSFTPPDCYELTDGVASVCAIAQRQWLERCLHVKRYTQICRDLK